ncbi:MAG TPA: protein-L-isoaspartate(D-aspartate) O-methyltransferase [Gillisia sp.]|nr:protein-L-isoaspartate(D-aspartate) O-methyltransferase [Gillisia sp.]
MKAAIFLIGILLFMACPPLNQDNFRAEREKMVRMQLAARGIKDQATLDAMRKVERHRLVPKEMVRYAYDDTPLPIGNGQTISQPYIVAMTTEQIRPRPGMKVLDIGTGSGYQAAVLAEIVDEVYSIEIVDELANRARDILAEMGYDNIHVKAGDGYHGWEEHAPFDAIVVAAAPETIPQPLLDQLKEGGRLIIPVGPPGDQYLRLVEKTKDGKIKERNLLPVRFVPFTRSQ